MTDRDHVLPTIRALLQKTVANGCPVEEAMAAHAKAQALIDKYQVSHEELYGSGPGRRWRKPEPEPEPKQQQQQAEPEPKPERAAEATEQANFHDTNDPDFRSSFRSSMTARSANALYWTFSGLAVVLLFLIARARRSPKFLKFCGAVALLIVGGIVWFRLDAQHREALQKQQYEQHVQADERRGAQQAEAERQGEAREAAQGKASQQEEALLEKEQRQAEAREAAQRQAAIEAQRAAAEREADAVISATDLSVSGVTLQNRYHRGDSEALLYSDEYLREAQVLTGMITNHSGQTLRYLEVEVTLWDCPVGYGADQCQVVGQQTVKQALLEIPPNQTRTFGGDVDFFNLRPPNPSGQRFFSWRIVTASSCSYQNLEAHQCAK